MPEGWHSTGEFLPGEWFELLPIIALNHCSWRISSPCMICPGCKPTKSLHLSIYLACVPLEVYTFELLLQSMHKWDPADYEKSSSAQFKWAMDLVSKLELSGDENVLDIGCGDGKITAAIAARVPRGRVLGIDLSGEMVEFARSKYPKSDYKNISFEQKDASLLDFQDEFDIVVSFACLHWVKDHIPVLEGIRRSLKSSGRILLQFGGKRNAGKILDITEDLIRMDEWCAYFQGFNFPYYFYGPEEYRGWLKQVRLKAKRVELVPKDMVHAGKSGLEGIIRNTWLPYTERLPRELRAKFIGEIAGRYIESHPLQDGMVHVKMVRLEVEAEK
jgi:trans-aconitate 2-methyltransferase